MAKRFPQIVFTWVCGFESFDIFSSQKRRQQKKLENSVWQKPDMHEQEKSEENENESVFHIP